MDLLIEPGLLEDMKSFSGRDEAGVPFIQRGDHVLKLDLSELDDHYMERAKNELRETPEVVSQSIVELKKLLEEENGLVLPLDDEFYLKKFLRPCKYYPDSTFQLMKRYYKFIHKYPKYGKDLMPSTVEPVFAKELLEFMPIRYKGTRIMVINIRNWDTKDFGIQLLVKSIIMAVEIGIIEPRTQVSGVHVILDLEGLSLSHVMQLSPMIAKNIVDFIQDCLPVRLKGIHIVNQPYIFNMAYGIFKPFIGEKLRKRLHFHGKKWEALAEHISEDFLPTYYGGSMELPSAPGTLLVEMLKDYEKDFASLSEVGYVNK